MWLSLVFLLLTLAVTAALLFMLLRPGAWRGVQVWALAALVPLLAALSASLNAQARAQRTLEHSALFGTQVNIITANRQYSAVLNPEEAACLERNLRLHWEGRLHTPGGFIPVNAKSQVTGRLPDPAAVDALSVQGRLKCKSFTSARKKEG